MSYLDVPRLHFQGRFRADTSTIDNHLSNFDPQLALGDKEVSWNAFGSHVFELKDCRVGSAIDGDGRLLQTRAADRVVGAAVVSTNDPYPAKMVDLDPDQRFVTQIYGLELQLSLSDSTEIVTGTMDVAALADLWVNIPGPGYADNRMAASYQSVLRSLRWDNLAVSPVARRLYELSPNQLSIKFVVDSFEYRSVKSDFCWGRIVGTVGPCFDNEPTHFIAGRRLTDPTQKYNPATAKVDKSRKRLIIDLGNSIPGTAPWGPIAPTCFQAAVDTRPPAASAAQTPITAADDGSLPSGYVALGEITATQSAFDLTAGIVELPLSDSLLSAADNHPLALFEVDAVQPTRLALQEYALGLCVYTEPPFLRMNPGQKLRCGLFATRFGRPAANLALDLQLITSDPNQSYNNIPTSALNFPPSVSTCDDGWAYFDLTAAAPVGKPPQRQFIDGQIYYVGGSWQAFGQIYQGQGNGALTILVFDDFPVKPNPVWADVQPIFEYYTRIYPYMTTILDLSDYASVKSAVDALQRVLALPVEHPHYMPVLRDLSDNKRTVILNWLKSGAPFNAASGGGQP
jgi:hypothetical protein